MGLSWSQPETPEVQVEESSESENEPQFFVQSSTCKNIDRVIKSATGYQEDPRKLNRILEVFTTVQIKRDNVEIQAAREYVMDVVQKILDKVKTLDSVFDFTRVRAGSDFQRVAVRTSSDFDIVLEFTGFPPFTMRTSEEERDVPVGWSTIEINTSDRQWSRLTDWRDKISSEKVRSRFSWCVEEARRYLGYSIVVKDKPHGPSIPLKITDRKGNVLNVDLVLAIKTTHWPREARTYSRGWPGETRWAQVTRNGTYLVPKLHSLHPDRDFLWNISFFAAENANMRKSPGCRKQTLRILKALNERYLGQPLTSYHLKNIWMYECEKYPSDDQWMQEKLGERFLGLLSSLEKCLTRNQCPQFFMPNVNLFKKFQPQNTQGLGNKVRRIQRDPVRFLDLQSTD